ncbi:hypothetical protein OE647_08875 [Defluviimonas sp. WL0075]|uniref:Lipoprotein n=1 Tax=Albidovulum sediminicola TaxID=2984331 RepID=A0ABT2Z1G5_9RHOB|nr:hypothetical protein [Defluviimonas sp. WL0075]
MLFVLAGCAVAGCYPTAESTEKFPVAAAATVNNVPGFGDCMMDGLNPMEGWMVNRRDVQQETRSDGIRIDTSVAAGNIQLTRTEMFSDGRVQIRIADYLNVALIDRDPEMAVFKNCVSRFGKR